MNADRARRALLRLMRATEADIERATAEAAAALRGWTEADIARLIEESALLVGDEIAAELVLRIEQSVRLGARAAFAAAGEGESAAARWIADHQDRLIARFSPRVQVQPTPVIRRGLIQVEHAIRYGQSAQEAAYRMRRAGHEPAVGVARQAVRAVAEARKAVLSAGPVAHRRFGAQVTRLEQYARRLGQQMERVPGLGMRGATLETAARLQDAVERMRPGLVEEAARYHVYHKVAYHERLTARTEMSRAYNGAFVDSARALGATRVRWVLNSVRHVPDVCDELAAGSSPGERGRGVYRIGMEPEMPAHPNCLCYWEHVLDESH